MADIFSNINKIGNIVLIGGVVYLGYKVAQNFGLFNGKKKVEEKQPQIFIEKTNGEQVVPKPRFGQIPLQGTFPTGEVLKGQFDLIRALSGGVFLPMGIGAELIRSLGGLQTFTPLRQDVLSSFTAQQRKALKEGRSLTTGELIMSPIPTNQFQRSSKSRFMGFARGETKKERYNRLSVSVRRVDRPGGGSTTFIRDRRKKGSNKITAIVRKRR